MTKHYNLMRSLSAVARRNAIYFQATPLSETVRMIPSFDGEVGRLIATSFVIGRALAFDGGHTAR